MARKGENIRKRKDGRYEARYKSGFKENGDPIYKSVYGRTYTEAKNNRLRRIAEGENRAAAGKTIGGLSEEWLRLKRLQVKSSTYAKYHAIVKTHIVGALRGISVNRLDQAAINKFIREMYEPDDKEHSQRAEADNKICGEAIQRAEFKF